MTVTEKDKIRQEIAERLQWAAVQFSKVRVPHEILARLNGGFSRALKPIMGGTVTPSEAQRIRNMLGVYKYAVIELMKKAKEGVNEMSAGGAWEASLSPAARRPVTGVTSGQPGKTGLVGNN